jgi:hypothetical protein
MPELFNEQGELVNETTASRAEQVVSTVKHHLECLADSGATPEELKAYAFTLTEDIASAVETVILAREASIVAKEAEEAEDDGNNDS